MWTKKGQKKYKIQNIILKKKHVKLAHGRNFNLKTFYWSYQPTVKILCKIYHQEWNIYFTTLNG